MKLTDFKTNKQIDIPADGILEITENAIRSVERDYPYSDVKVRTPDGKDEHEVRVVESKPYILKMAETERIRYE